MTQSPRLPDAVVRYAEHEHAVIDLHLPETPNGSLVVLVHGGFWTEDFDRTHTRDQAGDLADRGYLVATPEYRRVRGGGGWPTTGTDLENAVSALPGLLADLDLTWDRAVMTGHSAGGHLALWLLSRPLPISFDLVVGVAPIADLARAHELNLGDNAVGRLLDGAPITDADPMSLLAEAPSAAVQLIHGTDDEPVPIELSYRFSALHPWAPLTVLPDTGHFEFLDPSTPAWAAVVAALEEPTS